MPGMAAMPFNPYMSMYGAPMGFNPSFSESSISLDHAYCVLVTQSADAPACSLVHLTLQWEDLQVRRLATARLS